MAMEAGATEGPKTVCVAGRILLLRKWPWRPGLRFGKVLVRAFLDILPVLQKLPAPAKPDGEATPVKAEERFTLTQLGEMLRGVDLDALLTDERVLLLQEMLVEGVTEQGISNTPMTRADLGTFIEALPLEDMLTLAKEVIAFNVGFLKGGALGSGPRSPTPSASA
jgi:hypothetical protein